MWESGFSSQLVLCRGLGLGLGLGQGCAEVLEHKYRVCPLLIPLAVSIST